MNERTKRYLTEFLQEEAAWDKKTGKLNRDDVLQALIERRELDFYWEIYWPRIGRMTQRLKDWNWFPGLEFEIMEDDWDREIFWPANLLMEDWLNDRMEDIVTPIWNSEEWAYEESTMEEMLSLGIHCNEIPAKKFKGGAIQEGLW